MVETFGLFIGFQELISILEVGLWFLGVFCSGIFNPFNQVLHFAISFSVSDNGLNLVLFFPFH